MRKFGPLVCFGILCCFSVAADSELTHAKVVYFSADHPGEITCASKYPRRCSRRVDLWPSSVRCVASASATKRWLSECTSLGTGGLSYTFKGSCNASVGGGFGDQCSVEFDMDATVRSLGWGWPYYLLGFTTMVVLLCIYGARPHRTWSRQLLLVYI